MYADKKITKEDTWRPDELTKHLQGQDKKSKRREHSERVEERRERRERSEREEERRERREREEERRERRERSEREQERRERRERSERVEERQERREREEERRERRKRSEREEAQRTHRNRESRERMQQELERDIRREGQRQRDSTRERTKEPERDREDERRRKEKREAERRKEREREQHRYGEGREERTDRDENYDRGEKQTQRYKDREREENLGRQKDREREMERWHEKEREKHIKEREKKRERDTEKDLEKERERERRERERERGHLQKQVEWKGERREKPRQMSGSANEEGRREKKKREKEYRDVEAVENVRGSERRLRQLHHEKGDEAARERTSGREETDSKNSREQRHHKYENSHGNREQEVDPEVLEVNDEVALCFRNEDYEDDFEDFEEEEVDQDEGKEGEEDENGEREGRRELSPWRRDEIKAIQRAMEQENEMVSSAHSQPPTKRADPSPTESRPVKVQTHSRVIDFTAARQREARLHTAHRQQERRTELLRLIDLDFSATESLLDLPPVSEYDMYIKSFGMSNTKQVYVQCNEDNIDRHTQTEEPDACEKWTQHPAVTSAVCGGPKVSQNAPEAVSWMNIDSKRLATFLHSATQVMTVLLEESRRDCDSVKGLHSHTHSLSCSDRNLQLNTKLPFLHGRQVTLLHAQVHSLLSVHAPCSSPSDNTLHTHTLLCVWSIWEPSAPQRILACEAEVRSCCFSPGRASLVFAGTDVGSVLLWDLRERSSSHQRLLVDAEELTLRYPTFSTDAVLLGAGHFSSVVSVEPVQVTVEAELRQPLLTDQEESLGLSFQLGSLDENGHLILWVVVELPKADDSGSQADLGLRPGGRVKLLHSSSLQTCYSSNSRGPAEVAEVTGFMPHLSLLLKFLPSDSNHYFIGTNTGQVRRGTRHGLRVHPNLYTGVRMASVTALDFCTEPFFLVGCSDGTVRLHSLAWAEPVYEWHVCSDSVPVQSVYWCPTRPTVFYALDATSVLHVWDLTEREDWPISSQNLQPDRVTGMAVFGEVANQSLSSGFALARQSGRLEIHFLKQSLTLLRASDPETLRSLEYNTL